MLEVNNIGFERAAYVRKEAIKLLIIGPLSTACILFLMYLSMSRNIVVFYVIGLPYTILLMILIFIYAPLLMIKRHNKTIKEIDVSENGIAVETFPALWLKTQKIIEPFSKINTRQFVFPWYGKGKPDKKEGIVITINGNKDLYLVKEYFDDYDKILNGIRKL